MLLNILCWTYSILWGFMGLGMVLNAKSRKTNWFGVLFLFMSPFMAVVGNYLTGGFH